MKRLFVFTLALVLILVLVSTSEISLAYEEEESVLEARVVGVINGHTFDVVYDDPTDDLPTRIRAYLIDAPTDSAQRQCFASEAKRFVRELLLNRTVWIAHHERETPDRELLAFVYLDSRLNTLAQAVIVSQGWAEVQIRYREETHYRSEFEALEDEAEENKRGIWGDCDGRSLDPQERARVLINELEMNPPGLDNDHEWIELYNIEPVEINLSGWRIVATDGSFRTYTLPSGTKISAHGVLVIDEFEGDFFHNRKEVVELRTSLGEVIDRTPTGLNDTENDDRCWARTPNGASKWTFRTCTRGGGNGS